MLNDGRTVIKMFRISLPLPTHLSLLLERVGQIAVGVWEVGLQFDGSPVRVNGQVNQSLLVVNARQVAMHHRIVGGQIQCSQVSSHGPEKNE